MSKYLLDTNICIYIINRKPEEVYKKFKKIRLDSIYISSVTEFELRYGVEKSKKSEKNIQFLNDFISFLNLIPFDQNDSIEAGKLRNILEKKGNIIGPYDLLIGSQALTRKLVLVTNNEKEFSRIPGLKVENWVTNLL